MATLSAAADYRSDGPANNPVDEFLQLLARAVRQLHTYPPTSPLCTDAVAACHRAFSALDRHDRLAIRVTPRELIVEETGLGTGTIVEHEVVRRLHRGRVAAVEMDRAASARDFTHFCADAIRAADRPDDRSLAELLEEHGVESIAVRMAQRPEVLDVGAPKPAQRDLVDRERARRESAWSGPVDYLYPPDKGWVRVDPSAGLDSVSLVDLAVLVDEPADIAAMLLRLTDDENAGAASGTAALEQKFSDVAMLFSALDAHLARVMFSKLARSVLTLDEDRRKALLRRTILPGLLDGRAAGAVLRDFPDPDLAESLCLLLELETAAPEVVGAALNRLDLPGERREAVASLVEVRLKPDPTIAGAGSRSMSDRTVDGVDRFARRLVKVNAGEAKSFAEFAAFDLSIDEPTGAAIADLREAIHTGDVLVAQLECLWKLVRLEPNPAEVAIFLRRAAALFAELEKAGRWEDLAAAGTRYRVLSAELATNRPDVVEAIAQGLGEFWTASRVAALAALYDKGDEGRAAAVQLLDAFGPSLAGGIAAVVDDRSMQTAARTLSALVNDRGAALASGLAAQLPRCGVASARVFVRALGAAGAGYETAIGDQLASRDEQTVRAALRSLARIGTPEAASLVVEQIVGGTPAARAAEEALWHFPPAETIKQLRELLGRRDFVLANPDVAGRLIDRAAQMGAGDLGGALHDLEALRFRIWKPEVARVAWKAWGLRSR